MYRSSDGKTRDLVTSMPGAGWDFSINRHPYHEIEAPYGPHYCVYNRRLMACCFDKLPTVVGYWGLRTSAAVLNTGEFPLQFEGCLLYTSPSPRDGLLSRMPSSA